MGAGAPGQDGEQSTLTAQHQHRPVEANLDIRDGRLTLLLQVLQQHVAYWDADGDGVIWPRDTYAGCRRWGWSRPLCVVVAALIHAGLSWPTQQGWLPDPLLRIRVDRLHRAKHGSDSQTFDNEGRFRPQNFEDFFEKYDEGRKGGLDWWDLLWAWWGQRLLFDAFGIFASFLECEYLRLLYRI